MEKSCQPSSSVDSTTTRHQNQNQTQNPTDLYLKHLNKISHKISKPPIIRRDLHHHQHHQPPPPQQSQQPQQHQHQQQNHHQNQQQQQQQPPVYNINKSDFRDVVQKLTGSPAHDRFSTPPPIQPPKAPSSRLQRIRPPPLAHVSNRPPPPLTNNIIPHHHQPPPVNSINPNFIPNPNTTGGRQIGPLSPLPPFPSVHAAAESPISAYMRYLQSSTPIPHDSDLKRFPGHSPRWNNPNSHQFLLPSPPSSMPPSSPFMVPNSPLGFGRISSPRSPYPLLSPSLLFSPTSGQLGFPQSPRMPVASPRWRG